MSKIYNDTIVNQLISGIYAIGDTGFIFFFLITFKLCLYITYRTVIKKNAYFINHNGSFFYECTNLFPTLGDTRDFQSNNIIRKFYNSGNNTRIEETLVKRS